MVQRAETENNGTRKKPFWADRHDPSEMRYITHKIKVFGTVKKKSVAHEDEKQQRQWHLMRASDLMYLYGEQALLGLFNEWKKIQMKSAFLSKSDLLSLNPEELSIFSHFLSLSLSLSVSLFPRRGSLRVRATWTMNSCIVISNGL